LNLRIFLVFVTGAAQPKLTMENLGRFPLAIPDVVEQQQIAEFMIAKDSPRPQNLWVEID